MATSQSPPTLAPHLPIASLPTINYHGLVNGDAVEAKKLLSVSIHEGFFYLDLRGEGGSEPTLDHVDQIYQFMRRWFNKPAETKLQDLQTCYTDGYDHKRNSVHEENN